MNELIDNLARELKRKKAFMCTAESCTGGLIAATCTNYAGSSEWFKGGVVSYSNEMKMRVLDVPEAEIAENGAVSLPVVEAMAVGALKLCEAQAAIAVSGIAGPGGGSPDKPVGTVCIAVAMQTSPDSPAKISSRQLLFKGSRNDVREQAVFHSLLALKQLLAES